jgi:hypothetical protein
MVIGARATHIKVGPRGWRERKKITTSQVRLHLTGTRSHTQWDVIYDGIAVVSVLIGAKIP